MAKTPAASLLLLTTLLQLLLCCNASGPLHIHLSLNGNTDPRFQNIKESFFKNVNGFSETELADVKNQIKEKHIRLYISADFKVTRAKAADDKMKYYIDAESNQNGKDVAGIVSKMIPSTAIGLVVFPTTTTQLFSGCKFLEDFEKYIHNTHKDLSVGRETIHLYFTLGDSSEQDAKEIGKTFKQQKDDDWLISVVINKDLKFKKFIKTGEEVALSEQPWSDVTQSVYQVLIHEADTVMVPIVAKCAAAPKALKVGGFTAPELSKQLLKVLKGNDLSHPYQTVVTQLPDDCGTDEQRKTFTEELINSLRNSHLVAYGKEPSAVLYVCQDDAFCRDVKKRITSTHHKIQYYLSDKVVKDMKHSIVEKKSLDVKELSVEFHCHGSFRGESRSVCGQQADKLAETLTDFLNHFQFTSPPSIQIVFYACNVGTIKGRKYIRVFWDKLRNHIKNIKEIIAFTSWTTQGDSTPMVTIAEEDIFKASKVIDEGDVHPDAISVDLNDSGNMFGKVGLKPVNYAFGRFTVKVRINENEYKEIPVLPKTELDLEKKQQA